MDYTKLGTIGTEFRKVTSLVRGSWIGSPNIAGTLARSRVQMTYLYCHGRMARLSAPQLFTELIQYRKLYERDPRFPRLADKVAAKEEVAAILGREWIIPTLWHGVELRERPDWPLPFVVKSRHGCNQRAFIRSPQHDWEKLRRRTRKWMARRYGYWLDEWLYTGIEPGLLVEPFVGSLGVLPIDYKLFVFGGQVAFIQVHLERETAHRWIVLDREWRQLTISNDAPPRPNSMPAMIRAAEALGRNFDFVRVDFYEVAGQPKFGEMTFYPGSGLYRLDPAKLDVEMGALWRSAKSRSTR